MARHRSHRRHLALLRDAQARRFQLQVEEHEQRELVRALEWRLDRAERRMRRVAVSGEERKAHLNATRDLYVARRRLVIIADHRRLVDGVIARHRRVLDRARVSR